ncbi:lyase family protein [Paenibacillus sp. SC116]|uniref:argininosuccinate lyase n=1 Tax=Paenibacillus sp. SC116 TaxID=2968986 RepID=UPI00215A7BAB|nr:lyase family protein [Paenibacillus sp. SC116]MCR8844955.1 lyase family protein [Paenibacillus sp. SC116]
MNQEKESSSGILTGRIKKTPSVLLDETVLRPQFAYELEHLLPFYLRIEKVMVVESVRLGLMTESAAQEILHVLEQINEHTLTAESQDNMSDICFAIERYVELHVTERSVTWHADRSRNDVQATAQLMFAREQLLSVLAELMAMSDIVQKQAERTATLPMPGYTHYQPAQIITVGFYLAAINEQIGHTIDRLLSLYDKMNACPLGAGAMAGLELAWNREQLAERLGFERPCRHALVSVASKEWMLHIGSELSTFSITLSRFITDFITWGSSEYRFIDLPDELSGISSAMPQKKNFPVLERIRGKTAHMTAYYVDFAMAQRNTPFTNLVETAKEGGSNFIHLISNANILFRLFTTVIEHLHFRENRMYQICSQEFFGGFSLANKLSLQGRIPYRRAQVIAGRYIVWMMEHGRKPSDIDLNQLQQICREQGYKAGLSEVELRNVFDVEHSLYSKITLGSTHPKEVTCLLAQQKKEREIQRIQWKQAIDMI